MSSLRGDLLCKYLSETLPRHLEELSTKILDIALPPSRIKQFVPARCSCTNAELISDLSRRCDNMIRIFKYALLYIDSIYHQFR